MLTHCQHRRLGLSIRSANTIASATAFPKRSATTNFAKLCKDALARTYLFLSHVSKESQHVVAELPIFFCYTRVLHVSAMLLASGCHPAVHLLYRLLILWTIAIIPGEGVSRYFKRSAVLHISESY